MTYTPQKVLITGATSDFGVAFAKGFAALGCALVLHGRNAEKLAELQAHFPKAEIIQCDLSDAVATKAAFAPVQGIDVLVNNAGGALGLDKFQAAPLDDVEAMVQMNVLSTLRVTHAILPQMVANKRGHIITIGSVAGNWPYMGGHTYCASKAFVRQFALSLRGDLVGTNVRVTNIEPGLVETEFSLKRFKGDAERAHSVYANTVPLTAGDIADTVLFVATLPEHANVTSLEIMPTKQCTAPLLVDRT